MENSRTVTGQKISQLCQDIELQQKDLFVFSKFTDTTSHGDIYNTSRSITYSNLSGIMYDNFSKALLYDSNFLDGLYAILSSRLLNDDEFIKELKEKIGPVTQKGKIYYNSCYPGGEQKGKIYYNSSYNIQ